MRTKLDEIVEEAMRHPSVAYWSKHAENTFKTIAERAFRHGVEQFARFGYVAEGRRHIVQPEPVGEKSPDPHAPWCNYFNHPGACFDRRKGQRRKETLIARLCSVNIYRSLTDNNVWDWDRRSGKDRRKA